MKFVRQLTALMMMFSVLAYADGNSWDRVRYNGGTLQTKVDPKDWGNRLTVTSDEITFKVKDGQTINISTKSVTGLSYGQEAHRRVGTMIALGILVAPLALFGLFHKTRLHFIGVEYTTPEGKRAGLLLQGDKDNYRAILMALKSATGAPLSVAEEDRKYVPTGVGATTVKDDGGRTQLSSSQAASAETSLTTSKSKPDSAVPTDANVAVASSPDSADLSVDGVFVGNTPATISLTPGKHTVKVNLQGYAPWVRDIQALPGSRVSLTATLIKAESMSANQAAAPAPTVPSTSPDKGTVSVTSNPEGAEIFIDSAQAGHAPATLKLTPGKHSVQVVMSGYKDFIQDVSVTSGAETAVNATLSK
jgi:hypothetical protein